MTSDKDLPETSGAIAAGRRAFVTRYLSRVTGFALVSLAACGFQLRGEYNVPFASVFVSAPGTSQIANKLKRELADSPTKLSIAAKDAEAQLNITQEKRDRIILSLSGAGRVREYQLKLTVQYQLVDSKGAVAIPTSEIQLQRILTYDDSQVIAKQQEEALLFQDMERDAMQQILRRMTAIKRAA